MSPLLFDALSSLKISMIFCMSGNKFYARKKAILQVSHALELTLKSYLYQINPILIYKDIDKKITEDSLAVGFPEILIRLENLDVPVSDEHAKVIRGLQSKCEVIKRGYYALHDGDRELIADTLKYVLYFLEFQLSESPEKLLEPEWLQKILGFIDGRIEKDEAADQLLDLWLKKNWPQWDMDAEDAPKEFAGTDMCPQCQNQYLVVEQVDKPYCFWCRDEVPVEYCDDCGEIKMVGGVCCPN